MLTHRQITHPVGYLTGFISRAPYATLAETTYVNTLKNGKKEAKSYCAILTYAEEVCRQVYSSRRQY